MPTASIESPSNVATPLMSVFSVVIPDRVPAVGLVPIATSIATPAPGTGLPSESSIWTTGCGANGAPATALPGCVVKAR